MLRLEAWITGVTCPAVFANDLLLATSFAGGYLRQTVFNILSGNNLIKSHMLLIFLIIIFRVIILHGFALLPVLAGSSPSSDIWGCRDKRDGLGPFLDVLRVGLYKKIEQQLSIPKTFLAYLGHIKVHFFHLRLQQRRSRRLSF
jgi:hypothetical protein